MFKGLGVRIRDTLGDIDPLNKVPLKRERERERERARERERERERQTRG